MRVRNDRSTESRRRSGVRRGRLLTRSRPDAPPPEAPSVPAAENDGEPEPQRRDARARDTFDERRWKASNRPRDRAEYTCTCGYVFEAAVSTDVRCPNCGESQAW